MLARVFDSYIDKKTFWSSTGEVYLLPAVGLLGVVKWQVSSRDDFPNDLISPRVTCNGEMWLAGKGRICGACHNCQRQGRKQWKVACIQRRGGSSICLMTTGTYVRRQEKPIWMSITSAESGGTQAWRPASTALLGHPVLWPRRRSFSPKNHANLGLGPSIEPIGSLPHVPYLLAQVHGCQWLPLASLIEIWEFWGGDPFVSISDMVSHHENSWLVNLHPPWRTPPQK